MRFNGIPTAARKVVALAITKVGTPYCLGQKLKKVGRSQSNLDYLQVSGHNKLTPSNFVADYNIVNKYF